jgi:hypothetical protein
MFVLIPIFTLACFDDNDVLPFLSSLDVKDFHLQDRTRTQREDFFENCSRFSRRDSFFKIFTFVIKTRIESFYISFAHTRFDDIPRKRIFSEIIQGIVKRLRILDLKSVFSPMASQQANNVNYSHE